MDGWIKLWRRVRENEVWMMRPYSPGQAFVELLLGAAVAPHSVIYQSQSFALERAQLVKTRRQLAREWGWGDHRIARFLRLLENRRMVEVKNDAGAIRITVLNYETYQGDDAEATHPVASERRTGDAPSTHPRRTREEGQQQQEGKEDVVVLESKPHAKTSGRAGSEVPSGEGPAAAEKAAGGSAKPSGDGALDRPNYSWSLVLLLSGGVRKNSAELLARDRTCREAWEAVAQGRGRTKPGGWIRRALEERWDLPRTMTADQERELLEEIARLRREAEARFNARAGIGMIPKRAKLPRWSGEPEPEYLRRMVETRRIENGLDPATGRKLGGGP